MADIMPSRSLVKASHDERLGLFHLPRGSRRLLQRKFSLNLLDAKLSRRLRRSVARSLTGTAVVLALSQSVDAATITVNTNKAEIKPDGKCSILEAVANANDGTATYTDCAGGTGVDTIVLPANSLINFPPLKGKNASQTISLTIKSTMTIQANGSRLIAKKSRNQITLAMILNSGNLTISNASISGFTTAILNGGTLTIVDSVLTGNSQGGFGGAINNGGLLTLEGCTLSNNTNSFGGAIYNSGTATIDNSHIENNTVSSAGGAVYNFFGHLTITNSTVSGNIAKNPKYSASGGAIGNVASYLGIFDSSITGNTVIGGGGLNKSPPQVGWAFGGAIDASGTVVVRNSTISDNKAIGAPGRPALGGAIFCGCSLSIENSTISGNAAQGGKKTGRAGAGAIWTSGVVTITNSTISGNSAVGANGAASYGGSVMNYHYLTIDSSTITANTANTQGGGIWNVETGGISGGPSHTQLDLNRNIVSGNEAAVGPEIYNYQRSFTTVSADNHNLFGFNNDPGVMGFTPGASDIIPAGGVTIGDILSSLADNGGPTLTHALVPGSPAIDAAPIDGDCPAADQRGVARPQGAMCDIGAFEK